MRVQYTVLNANVTLYKNDSSNADQLYVSADIYGLSIVGFTSILIQKEFDILRLNFGLLSVYLFASRMNNSSLHMFIRY